MKHCCFYFFIFFCKPFVWFYVETLSSTSKVDGTRVPWPMVYNTNRSLHHIRDIFPRTFTVPRKEQKTKKAHTFTILKQSIDQQTIKSSKFALRGTQKSPYIYPLKNQQKTSYIYSKTAKGTEINQTEMPIHLILHAIFYKNNFI